MKSKLLPLLLTAFLAACGTVQTAPPVVQCPRLPPVQWPAPEPSFTDRMESFLSGKLPEPTGSAYSLPSAKLGTTPR